MGVTSQTTYRSVRLSARRIVLPYILFSGAWIFLSDRLLVILLPDPATRLQWSIYKGWAFVLVTALLLAALLRVEAWRRQRLEEERARLQAQLLQAQKLESIGTLASGVAHEINNPVSAIIGYSQLIIETAGHESQAAHYASEIEKASKRVATIVGNLLSFAHTEKQPFQAERLHTIVNDTLSLIQAVLRHDQIALVVRIPESLPAVECRFQQIQQVLMNLLTNARDALNEKTPGRDGSKQIIITAESVAGTETSPPLVRLTVEDHGTGIPAAVRPRILDPFFTTKPRDKGTGLGLSISHGIIKDHGGRLWFESETGQWTKAHVDLLVVRPPSSTPASAG